MKVLDHLEDNEEIDHEEIAFRKITDSRKRRNADSNEMTTFKKAF